MMRRVPREALEAPPEPVVFGAAPSAPAAHAPAPPDPAALSAGLARALVTLLGDELSARPEHIRSLVERELPRLSRARHITLRAHPADLERLAPAEALRAQLELAATLALMPDATLERGGCVMESELGEIDARLETRLSLALALLQSGLV